MRILMINDHIHFGGGGDATFRHERQIYEGAGYEVFTFSHATETDAEKTENDFLHIESSNRMIQKTGKYLFNPRVYYQLRRLLKNLRPLLIHLHLPSKYPASIYAALKGYPVVHTLHGPMLFCATSWGCLKKDSGYCELGTGIKCYLRGCVPLWQLPLVYFLYRVNRHFAKKSVKLFIGPSRQICAAAERTGFGPVKYIPLCIDRMFYDVAQTDGQGSPTVIYVGGLSEQKGVPILLEAFSIIIRQIPEAKLILAGRGALLPLLKEKSREYGIESNVEFLGFVDHDKITEVYKRGQVFVLPSIWSEQFGLVGPEALACGLPCVASNMGGIGEWLKDGQWGYLVPPRDPQALAEKIVLLLKDRPLCERFARRGKEFVLKEYGVGQFEKNMLELAERHTDNSQEKILQGAIF